MRFSFRVLTAGFSEPEAAKFSRGGTESRATRRDVFEHKKRPLGRSSIPVMRSHAVSDARDHQSEA